MNTKLFGQFLLEKGYLTAEQLLHTLQEQRRTNYEIEELAVAIGLITLRDLEQAQFLQVARNQSFGEVALAEGLLKEDELALLLNRQAADRRLLGEVLRSLGYLDQATIDEALVLHEGARAVEEEALRERLAREDCPDLAAHSVAILAKVFQHTMKSPLAITVSRNEGVTDPTQSVWSQAISAGSKHYILGIMCGDYTALKIAEQVLGMEFAAMDDLAMDALSEFLNVVTGHVCAHLGVSGEPVTAEPPVVQRGSDFFLTAVPTVMLDCSAWNLALSYVLATRVQAEVGIPGFRGPLRTVAVADDREGPNARP